MSNVNTTADQSASAHVGLQSPETPARARAPRPTVARLKVHPDLGLYRSGTNSRQVAQATMFGQLMKAWLALNKSGCSTVYTSNYRNGNYRCKFWKVQGSAEELATNLRTFLSPWQGSVKVVRVPFTRLFSVICVLPTKPQVADLEAMRESMLMMCSREGDRVPEAKASAALDI